MEVWLGFVLLLATALADEPETTFSRIADIRALPMTEAAEAKPVHVRGVVTLVGGVAAGGYQVTVEKTTAVVPGAVAMPPDEFGAFPLGADPSAAKPLIPEKYFSPKTSGLSAEIKASGRNEISFTLK